ncbi:hypothetical protein BOTBODRAFT_172583 [Botryobasidium botryosum FD-172 SS1]|uniref:Uncharacterized protein n=1 Tax=Botryobasidium botryosum (strain FD-172 SS1) TaxID=930990 RepID=A0A067MYK5_BOTB1|nr:hypothetical protein BOTBODRAFT_172583 [Botryobasidium botryosum FD-172 SS1]
MLLEPSRAGQSPFPDGCLNSERAAELPFEGGDINKKSVAKAILDTLFKDPDDLQKDLYLPSPLRLRPRARAFLYRLPAPHPQYAVRDTTHMHPFALAPYISILNNPVPPLAASSASIRASAGKAPAFAPWVGGSLAGALKTGDEEILRERWDDAFEKSFDSPQSDNRMAAAAGG